MFQCVKCSTRLCIGALSTGHLAVTTALVTPRELSFCIWLSVSTRWERAAVPLCRSAGIIDTAEYDQRIHITNCRLADLQTDLHITWHEKHDMSVTRAMLIRLMGQLIIGMMGCFVVHCIVFYVR
jgi:hypothetical protein